jgi:hypothetical protein
MPRVKDTDQRGAVGATLVQLAVEEHLGWIYRRQDHRDTGIDAEVEVVLSDEAAGLVLGLQVKSGRSYFREPTRLGWRYRGDLTHLRYWTEHSLRVVVVLVDTTTRRLYWASVADNPTMHRARDSWTIEVPRSQEVNASCADRWMDLAWAANPRDALYRYCVLHREYVQLIAEGGRVLLEADDWINKTPGQAEFTVILEESDGDVRRKEEWSFLAGVHNVHDFACRVFPWADVGIDEDYYEAHEDVPPEAVFQDDESPGGYYTVPGERSAGIRPYGDTAGEVKHYRFELMLNDIGSAFATLDSCASSNVWYPPYYLARVLSRGRD